MDLVCHIKSLNLIAKPFLILCGSNKSITFFVNLFYCDTCGCNVSCFLNTGICLTISIIQLGIVCIICDFKFPLSIKC